MNATLRVDLDTLAHNIAAIREVVAPAQMMLVVKDDAYGHGVERVVRRAAAEGVTWFGAFDVGTGLAVRAHLGGRARIFVWIAASARDIVGAIAADLDIGIGDSILLEEIATAATRTHQTARVHLKIDTGLHRNGVRPEEWPTFVARAAQLQHQGSIDVVGVWSHIAEASDQEDDAARHIYENALTQAAEAGLDVKLRHFAASAAGLAREEFRYDLVRVGAFCYGIRSAGGPHERSLGLSLVSQLEARVLRVHGESVTIDVGSLDGIPSSLGMRVHIGTPSGSRLLQDVGSVESRVRSWPGAQPGDTVIIYGSGHHGELTPTDLAERIDTIGEEITVRVSPLIPREYAGD
ncbi:alanine racemase (plasmid) [Coraliomargarita sp. W4R53]